MLTKHKYKKSKIPLGQGSDVFKCCRKETPEDSKCVDCCYDTWGDELKEVTQLHAQKQEEYVQLGKKLGFISERRDKFKTWLNELDKAEELSRKICNQLDVIAVQSDKIWYNSCFAVQAIEVLFCMIRDFYSQVDYLKLRYDALQNCINKNTDPALVKDQGILKCLKEYYEKLEIVIKTRDDIVIAIVEATKLSNLIRNNINTKDCPEKNCPPKKGTGGYDPCKEDQKPCDCECNDNADSYYGFKTVICEWFCAFKCEDDCKPGEDPFKTEIAPKNQAVFPAKICVPETENTPCELVPIIGFPICKESYKNCLKKRFEQDDQTVKETEVKLKDVSKQKEALQACKDSLNKAIAEVDPKNRCK